MKKTTKAFLCIAALLLLVLSGVGCSPEKSTLVLGTSADYPPYEFHIMQDGKDTIVGFDIDIANAIADQMGMELEIKDMNFDGLLMALEQDQVDMVIAGMTPNDKRKQSVDFSIIYYYATHTAVLPEGKQDDYKELSDLDGLKIGVQKGAIQETIITENVNAKEVVALGKVTDLVLALQSGTVDAIFLEKPVAKAYCDANTGLALSAITYEDDEGGSAVAVKKGNQELLDKINATLSKLIEGKKIDEYVGAAYILAENSAE